MHRLYVDVRADIALATDSDCVQLPSEAHAPVPLLGDTASRFQIGGHCHSVGEPQMVGLDDVTCAYGSPILDLNYMREHVPTLGAEGRARGSLYRKASILEAVAIQLRSEA